MYHTYESELYEYILTKIILDKLANFPRYFISLKIYIYKL